MLIIGRLPADGAANTTNRFGALLVMGVIGTFFLYFAVNMAMVMGLAPVVGVPLPLVSFGGSAMIVILVGFGLVQSPMCTAQGCHHEPVRPLCCRGGQLRRIWEAPLLAAFAAAGLRAAGNRCRARKRGLHHLCPVQPGAADFTPFTRCKAVLSLWAGVERIVGNPTLTQPLAAWSIPR
jgi:hypothetical protein